MKSDRLILSTVIYEGKVEMRTLTPIFSEGTGFLPLLQEQTRALNSLMFLYYPRSTSAVRCARAGAPVPSASASASVSQRSGGISSESCAQTVVNAKAMNRSGIIKTAGTLRHCASFDKQNAATRLCAEKDQSNGTR